MELIGRADGGRPANASLIPPGGAEALAAAAIALFGDPARREEMSAAGKQCAATHSRDNSAAELRRLLIAVQRAGASCRVPVEVPVSARSACIEVARDIQA